MAKLKVVKGFTWSELNEVEARALFETNSVELYKLYDDGSDALIEDDADLEITLTRKIPIAIELGKIEIPNAYGVFIMIELARLHGLIEEELELDLTYEKGLKLYNAFLETEYSTDSESEHDGIEAFIQNRTVASWAEMASQLLLTNKGLTHSHKRCRFMEEGESFFVIGTNGHEKVYSELPSSKDIIKFYEDNKELLMSGDLCLGGWLDEVNENYVLDVSMLVPTGIGVDEAVLIGKKHGQVAIFDMRDSSVIFVDAHLARNSVFSEL
jgi:hypothetical protein